MGDILAGTSVALAGATSAALVTPGCLAPHSTAIILSAIDLHSGTGIGSSIIALPSGIETDFSIIGSLETGLPFSAWATLTDTPMAATRAYGRHGDGAGGTSATERHALALRHAMPESFFVRIGIHPPIAFMALGCSPAERQCRTLQPGGNCRVSYLKAGVRLLTKG